MVKTFKIDWVERKTSAKGTNYSVMTLTDEEGKRHDKVSIFDVSDEIQAGRDIKGDIVQKGDYFNFIKAPTEGVMGARPAYAGGVAKSMARKEESIERFQNSKEEGIKISGTARDATMIVTTFYPELSMLGDLDKEIAIKEKWQYWRNWLIENWDVKQPF
jgi:hypothetical protein